MEKHMIGIKKNGSAEPAVMRYTELDADPLFFLFGILQILRFGIFCDVVNHA